eukprot:5323732-Prymnesium_polylepis.1
MRRRASRVPLRHGRPHDHTSTHLGDSSVSGDQRAGAQPTVECRHPGLTSRLAMGSSPPDLEGRVHERPPAAKGAVGEARAAIRAIVYVRTNRGGARIWQRVARIWQRERAARSRVPPSLTSAPRSENSASHRVSRHSGVDGEHREQKRSKNAR